MQKPNFLNHILFIRDLINYILDRVREKIYILTKPTRKNDYWTIYIILHSLSINETAMWGSNLHFQIPYFPNALFRDWFKIESDHRLRNFWFVFLVWTSVYGSLNFVVLSYLHIIYYLVTKPLNNFTTHVCSSVSRAVCPEDNSITQMNSSIIFSK